jgi:hypothetical protein
VVNGILILLLAILIVVFPFQKNWKKQSSRHIAGILPIILQLRVILTCVKQWLHLRRTWKVRLMRRMKSGGFRRPSLIYAVFRAICDKGDKSFMPYQAGINNHYTHFVRRATHRCGGKTEKQFHALAEVDRPFVKEASHCPYARLKIHRYHL